MPPHIPWGAEHGQVQQDLHGAAKAAELRGKMVGCPVASWPADSPRAYDDGRVKECGGQELSNWPRSCEPLPLGGRTGTDPPLV